jgi:hypothetical protein
MNNKTIKKFFKLKKKKDSLENCRMSHLHRAIQGKFFSTFSHPVIQKSLQLWSKGDLLLLILSAEPGVIL